MLIILNLLEDDCDEDITCGTNEKCKMNVKPICLCKHGYKKDSNMECVKDKRGKR